MIGRLMGKTRVEQGDQRDDESYDGKKRAENCR